MVEVSYDQTVRVFIKMRDARAALKEEWETKDRAIKEQQDTIQQLLLAHMNANGIESFRTGAGTVYRTEKLIPQGSDWNAFYNWVKEHNAFDFIFKRIKADAVKDYMEQHNGAVPPGVSVYGEYGVNIRRK